MYWNVTGATRQETLSVTSSKYYTSDMGNMHRSIIHNTAPEHLRSWQSCGEDVLPMSTLKILRASVHRLLLISNITNDPWTFIQRQASMCLYDSILGFFSCSFWEALLIVQSLFSLVGNFPNLLRKTLFCE